MSGVDLSQYTGVDVWDKYEENAKGGQFEPIPANTYDLQVENVAGPIENNAKDGYYLKAQCRVLQDKDGNTDYANRVIFQIISLKQESLWFLQQFLSAMGKAPGDQSMSPGEFDGNYCTAQVAIKVDKTGTYGPQNQIKRWMKYGAGRPDESSTEASARW